MRLLSALLALAAFASTVPGCGPANQKYVKVDAVSEASSTQRVREWLDAFSKTGQPDSGVSTIRDELAKLNVPGRDANSLQTDFDAAVNNPNVATRKKLAADLLAKIPADAAANK